MLSKGKKPKRHQMLTSLGLRYVLFLLIISLFTNKILGWFLIHHTILSLVTAGSLIINHCTTTTSTTKLIEVIVVSSERRGGEYNCKGAGFILILEQCRGHLKKKWTFLASNDICQAHKTSKNWAVTADWTCLDVSWALTLPLLLFCCCFCSGGDWLCLRGLLMWWCHKVNMHPTRQQVRWLMDAHTQ